PIAVEKRVWLFQRRIIAHRKASFFIGTSYSALPKKKRGRNTGTPFIGVRSVVPSLSCRGYFGSANLPSSPVPSVTSPRAGSILKPRRCSEIQIFKNLLQQTSTHFKQNLQIHLADL